MGDDNVKFLWCGLCLAIPLGCGLRRRELAELTLESLQRREERCAIVDLGWLLLALYGTSGNRYCALIVPATSAP
jgi:hypothetical protein